MRNINTLLLLLSFLLIPNRDNLTLSNFSSMMSGLPERKWRGRRLVHDIEPYTLGTKGVFTVSKNQSY